MAQQSSIQGFQKTCQFKYSISCQIFPSQLKTLKAAIGIRLPKGILCSAINVGYKEFTSQYPLASIFKPYFPTVVTPPFKKNKLKVEFVTIMSYQRNRCWF
ncbi:hypothetical protein PPERSA_02018 [Pseudocohnilembus persalinus]|uniref:Uncharacterized protein n=1 Tax=Pseudocohnilembus persalinus TaxID=266149 RepID=A0A0V0QF65_PSEPJ|nr:hypothetical protein PPERSA_02018 [Pseudocohnilembus persalinus]|eukprot:KRX00839.1 hypothetical protein PPERSA_02018 [Pseudocohnilembus persalinus]